MLGPSLRRPRAGWRMSDLPTTCCLNLQASPTTPPPPCPLHLLLVLSPSIWPLRINGQCPLQSRYPFPHQLLAQVSPHVSGGLLPTPPRTGLSAAPACDPSLFFSLLIPIVVHCTHSLNTIVLAISCPLLPQTRNTPMAPTPSTVPGMHAPNTYLLSQ